MAAYTNDSVLPWMGTYDEERRFERILMSLMVLMLILAIAIPLLPLFKLAIEKIEEPPVPIKLLTPPPRRVIPPAAAPVPKPEPTPADAKAKEKPAPAPKPVPSPEAARDRAARRLAATARELSSLRDTPVISSIDSQRQLSNAAAADKSATADLSALQASRNSGGISTSGIGTTGPGTSLDEKATGGSGAGSTGAGSTGGGGNGRQGAYKPTRCGDCVQQVFDLNKGAFQALYQRTLRESPDLRGDVTIGLTILPSGKVSECHILSSALHNPELEGKIVSRVLLLKFDAEDVPVLNAKQVFHFYPQ